MSTKRQRSRLPLKVELEANEWDRQVELLSQKGFFAGTISSITGLSISQVRYRQHAFGVSPTAYRRGESAVAHAAIEAIQSTIKKLQLRKLSEVYGSKSQPKGVSRK